MKHSLVMTLIVAALMSALPALAHHSFPATYLTEQEMTIEGELVAFLYRNPHAFVHLNVMNEKGEPVRWAVEWGGVAALADQNVTRDTLKPGDHVIIVGNPGRDPEDHRLRMRNIKRPVDGWTWGGDFD